MERTKNVLGTIFLLLFILFFVVGGYFLMQYVLDEKNDSEINKVEEPVDEIDIRADKTKDYIYYINEKEVLESVDIIYRDAIFNLESMNEVNNILSQDNQALEKTIKYVKDMQDVDLTNAEANDEGIYSLEYREYSDYIFKEYLSLVVKDFYYDIINGVKATSVNSYVVNKNTGERIAYDKLLQDNNLTMDQVKEKIKKRLSDTQLLNDEFTINIDETINNLGTYALYINKTGKLSISFVVKTNKNNYNDAIELY